MVTVFRDGTEDLSKERLSYEQAIAACAHSLLTTDDSSALETAARSLLSATDAQYLFIDRNVDDPEAGFSAANVVTVSKDQKENSKLDVWNRVPWSTMPAARGALSSGEIFMYAVEALKGSERDLIEALGASVLTVGDHDGGIEDALRVCFLRDQHSCE